MINNLRTALAPTAAKLIDDGDCDKIRDTRGPTNTGSDTRGLTDTRSKQSRRHRL